MKTRGFVVFFTAALFFVGLFFVTNSAFTSETELVNISNCSGKKGNITPIPGNPAETVAAFDETHNYITWFTNENTPTPPVVVTKYDGTSCAPPVKVNIQNIVSPYRYSHDAPSVFVDGDGYIYLTYLGYTLYELGGRDAPTDSPFIRKSNYPNDITSWGPERKMRFSNFTELNGIRLNNGDILFVASDMRARIDVIKRGGIEPYQYKWSAMRQVVAQDTSPAGDPSKSCIDPATGVAVGCQGNRFTKAVVEQGKYSGKLYAVWGWVHHNPTIHYFYDSHEVYFAYSEDEGLTWKNKAGTKEVAAPLCPPPDYCKPNTPPFKGILHYDPDFKLTNTRQGDKRAVWEDVDGTIYLAFYESLIYPTTATGALKMLKFTLGSGVVEEKVVSNDKNSHVAGIRKEGSDIYIWASNDTKNGVYEYVSGDGGNTWIANEIIKKGCRLHGTSHFPGLDSIRLGMACYVGDSDSRDIYYYRRTFATTPVSDTTPPLPPSGLVVK